MRTPRIILGTMTFGGPTSQETAAAMILDFCCNEKWKDLVRENPQLDSAIMYQGGKTEVLLGNIIQDNENDVIALPKLLSLASKANPFTSDKDLSPSGVRSQLETSLKALQRKNCDIFYLHAPDVNNHIEPTLEEVQKLYTEKKFNKLGLSNFSAWETVYIHFYMSSRNYVIPTIYQGMYNAITREIETELLPALRKLGMSFYAYNPLAGGMLSGKYQPAETDEEAAKLNSNVGDRFAGNSFWAKRYRERFQQKEQFEALETVRNAIELGAENEEISMAEASLRWLRHHSKLTEQDGIIIGASKTSHYNANMKSLAAGPLPESIVQAYEEANFLCRNVCPNYSRGFSGSALEI